MIVITVIARLLCWWFAIGCSLGLCWVVACLTTRRVMQCFPAARLDFLYGLPAASAAREIADSSAASRLLSAAPLPRRLAPQSRLARRDGGRSSIVASRHSA